MQDVEDSRASGSPRLALGFSCVGHFLFHYFAAMYFTIVLALSKDWTDQNYVDLLTLWTPASMLIGLLALPAGRLADKWSSPGMLTVMFLGMGGATIACGFAAETTGLMVFLCGIGLFGAIYHPVGIPWIIKTADGPVGMRLAVNNIFGGLGGAAAGGATGLLADIAGWRIAFIAPGIICVILGLAMLFCVARGMIQEGEGSGKSKAGGSDGRGNIAAFAMLLFPMFAVGLIYNTMQAGLPKLFEEGMTGWLGGDIVKIGFAVTIIYSAAAVMQVAGGLLADRHSLKWVYCLGWLIHLPMLLLMAMSGEVILFLASMMMVIASSASLPSENMLLSRFAPAQHQSLAFGVKYVLAFGAAPLGIWLINVMRDWTGDFTGLLYSLAAVAAAAFAVVLLLPGEGTSNRGTLKGAE